jgi:hypothetical protein
MLNFNTQPYYDDFNEDKNFHRILFKPGVAVQARELTQAQSILQDQIGKFGKFVLSDGSNVSGGKYTFNSNVKSLNLQNTGSIATDIEFFTGMFVVGAESKCVSLITSCDVLNYYITVKALINGEENYKSNELLYIFSSKDVAYAYHSGNQQIITNSQFDYLAQLNIDQNYPILNCSGQKDSFTFNIQTQTISVGDVITVASDNYSINYIVTEIGYDGTFRVHQQLKSDYSNVAINVASYASNHVLEISFSDGVYFTNNAFVKSLPQSIIPNLRTQYPSACIGYEVIETIVDYIDDTSLLDPAQGSYNYTAPGADRYKIYLSLVSKPLINGGIDQTALTTSKFIELLRIKDGVVVFDNTSPVLGGLQDVLAAQMYDHAGNFIVTPFNISFSDADFTDTTTTLNTVISSGKAYVFGYPYNATFPTYLSVDKARDTANSLNNITNTYYGNSIRITDVSGKLPIPTSGSRVEIHSSDKNSTSNATRLGYAYISNIDYTTTNEYSINLYGLTVSDQKLLIANSIVGGGFTANTILTSGVNFVTDPAYNKLIFKLPYANPADIYDASITLDSFTTLPVQSNIATLTSQDLTRQFSSGTSNSLPLDLKNQNFIIVAKTSNGAYTAGQYIPLSQVNIKVEQLVGEYKATFTFTSGYTGSVDIKYSLVYTAPQYKTKTIHKNTLVQINCGTIPTSIGYSDIVEFKGIFRASTAGAFIPLGGATWSSASSYERNSVIIYGDKVYISSISGNLNNIPGTLTSDKWTELKNTEINYKTDNGQKEFLYDHGTVAALSNTNTGPTFVLFDYFEHSTGEYISFKSYPDTYKNIPATKINNVVYNLRDYIDFRPRRKDSGDSTTVLFDSYKIPSSITDTKFYYDMSFYLGRIDKLILTAERKLQWHKGVSSYKNFIPPKDIPNGMTIALIQFDAYTADSKSIKIDYAKHRRYTMDDIGTLDTRLKNVEYYTALTMGEKTTLGVNIIDQYGTRLKNGFIVDAFTDYTIVDLSENDLHISLDLDKNVARPAFTKRPYSKVSATWDDFGTGKNLKQYETGLVSFDGKFRDIEIQDQATSYIKINQFDSISYKGKLYLSPQNQEWVEQYGATINKVDENTTALADAKSTPGLVYNDWQKFYSNITDFTIEDNSTSEVKFDKKAYSVSTAITGKKETHNPINVNVIPKTKQTTINFRATGMAPLTRMYVYINNRIVNAYVTPDYNPLGIITGVTISNGGAGYSETATANLTSTSTIQAGFKLNIVGGVIDNVQLTNPGRGYATNVFANQHMLTITDSTHTTTANLIAHVVPVQAMYLYTDNTGECSGQLIIPNNDIISFDAGELLITVCDTPHYDISNCVSSAQGIFYSRFSFYENVITSIRKPYIKFLRDIPDPPAKPQIGGIVVPQEISYTISDYRVPYTETKAGIKTIPVYLTCDVPPTSDVTVTYMLNASKDQSSGVGNITASPASFTFTPSNYSTPQSLTYSYNLGDEGNKLGSYIEFYATSATDDVFNYKIGTKPAEVWKKDRIAGVAVSRLQPKNILDPTPYVPPVQTAVVNATNLTIANAGGKSSFVVTYGGTGEIGWLTKSTTSYPLTFTATSDNDNVVIISSKYNQSGVPEDVQDGATRTIGKYQNEYLSFMFNVYGKNQGIANVTTTITSSNPNWQGKTAVSRITVGAAIQPDVAQIIILPNEETTPSTGTFTNADRYTTSKGITNVIGVKLSRQPSSSVTVNANSSVITGGGDVTSFSNDFSTYASGNTITFSTSNWNEVHSFIVSGYDNVNNTAVNKQDYRIDLKSASSDSSFAGLTKSVNVTNTDYAISAGEPKLTFVGHKTTGNTSTISLSVILTSKPESGETVRVSFESLNTATGGIIVTPSAFGANGILQFTDSTAFDPQTIVIRGAFLEAATSGDSVNYTLKCVSNKWDTVNNKAIPSLWTHTIDTPLTNSPFIFTTDTVVTVSRTKSYTANPLGRKPTAWTPAFTADPSSSDVSAYAQTNNAGKTTNVGTINSYEIIKSNAIPTANYIQYEIKFNGKSQWSGTDDGGGPVTSLAEVTVGFRSSSNDVMFYNGMVSSPTKPSVWTNIRPVTLKGINPNRYFFQGLIKYKGKDGSNGKQGAVNVSVIVNLTGFYFDPFVSGFSVVENVTQYTTTTTFRTDTFAIISENTVTTTLPPTTISDWKSSPESVQACIDSLITNPDYLKILPPVEYVNSLFSKYTSGPYTSDIREYNMNTLLENQKSLGIFIEKIRSKIVNNPTFGEVIDAKLKTLYDTKLNEYNSLVSQINKLGYQLQKSAYTPIPIIVLV